MISNFDLFDIKSFEFFLDPFVIFLNLMQKGAKLVCVVFTIVEGNVFGLMEERETCVQKGAKSILCINWHQNQSSKTQVSPRPFVASGVEKPSLIANRLMERDEGECFYARF